MRQDLLEQLRQALRTHTDPNRAEHERRYLKSDDRFLGVTLPLGDRIAKDFRRACRDLPFSDIRAIAHALWQGEYHEEKRLAVQLLDLYCKALTREDWPLLLDWVRDAGSWDLIDDIATHLLGSLSERFSELDKELDWWITDANLWVRRAALVSYVLRLRHGTVAPARVRQLCDSLMQDREYFVKKALGWVLRECAVQDAEGTVAFLQRWNGSTARPIVREAIRKLDPAWQQQILLG